MTNEKIMSTICDSICRHPYRVESQEELDAICADCVVNKLEASDGDLISRADAIEAVAEHLFYSTRIESKRQAYDLADWKWHIGELLEPLPSASVEVGGYTEWLEKLIVDLEIFEWICENTPCPEWCEENCSYASIQKECLRHLYEVSKGGEDE